MLGTNLISSFWILAQSSDNYVIMFIAVEHFVAFKLKNWNTVSDEKLNVHNRAE